MPARSIPPGRGCPSSIAVVGFHGRFPDARDVRSFWRNLCEVRDSVSFFDREEVIAEGEPESIARDPAYVPARAIAPEFELFDTSFFGMNAREAAGTDPQHRVLLEEAWAALEQAGIGDRSRRRRFGVYASCSMSVAGPAALTLHEQGDFYEVSIGTYPDFLASRISHFLDLSGPSLAVSTGCSSSLVAIHLACQAIRSGECDTALAGGASFWTPERVGYLYQEGGVHSPDGHCRPFDASAEGMIGGTGAAMVVLMDFDRAVAEGHEIWGVIRGSAVNNDGAGATSFSAPSETGQVEVITAALLDAGLDPGEIGFIEGHGTATAVGDRTEVAALHAVFEGLPSGSVRLGSLKGNVGHLDAAAGVTGFLKALLTTRWGIVPGTAHFRSAHPSLEIDGTPFRITAETEPWQGEATRRAAVSSFGIGGTNAHIIVEQGPAPVSTELAERPRVLRLSTRTERSLDEAGSRLAETLEREPVNLLDAERTLREGRNQMAFRLAVAASDPSEAAEKLRAGVGARAVAVEAPLVGFMFSGQGSQRPGLARALWDREPDFREELAPVLDALRAHLDCDLDRLLLNPTAPASAIERTDIAQPALFAIEAALAGVWQRRGVEPGAVLGHSIGELTAAYVAGCLSLEDAAMLVAGRGRLMQELPGGAMAGILTDPGTLEELLAGELEVAAFNAPEAFVVAGPSAAVVAFEERAAQRAVSTQRLRTAKAFHSRLVEPATEEFAKLADGVSWREPTLRLISNLTGKPVGTGELASGEYWARHMREPVLFGDGVKSLVAQGCNVLLEVGPGQALVQLSRLSVPDVPVLASAATPDADLSEALAGLWVNGIDAESNGARGEGRLVPLPTYPFERERPGSLARPQIRPEGDDRDGGPRSVGLYVSRWQRAVRDSSGGSRSAGVTLVVGDGDGIGAALVERLVADGHEAVHVRCPPLTSEAVREESWWRASVEAAAPCAAIVHLLSLDCREGAESGITRRLAFHSVVALARALASAEREVMTRLEIVTANAFAVLGGDAHSPAGALAHGAAMGVCHDLEKVDVRIVDLDLDESDAASAAAQLAPRVLGAGGRLAALRRGGEWTRVFSPAAGSDEGPPTPPAGCILITGGTGGVGQAIARRLAAAGQTNLVLISRSGSANAVESLTEAGTDVVVERADVTSEAQMRTVMSRAQARFGTIRGCFHAAGVPDRGSIVGDDHERAEAVLAPKVLGSLVIRELAAEFGLGFVCFTSSLAAVGGARGRGAYAAANGFMDSLAASSGEGPALVSVNLDVWRDGGMALRGSHAGLTDDEGVDALLRCLAFDEPQALVACGPIGERLARAEEGDSGKSPAAEVEAPSIAAIWGDVLGLAELAVDADLAALGATSLQAMMVVSRIQRAYRVRLPVRTVLRSKTPGELDDLVAQEGHLRTIV